MSAARVQAERALQAELLLRLRAGSWPILPLATPNGMFLPAHSDDDRRANARLIARLKADGMLVAGMPDLALFWAGGCALVETKRPAFRDLLGYHAAGRASPDQREFARRCEGLGIHHGYVRSWESLVERLDEWGAPRP